MAEWSKACGSGPHLSGGAGSNPASFKLFLNRFSVLNILENFNLGLRYILGHIKTAFLAFHLGSMLCFDSFEFTQEQLILPSYWVYIYFKIILEGS